MNTIQTMIQDSLGTPPAARKLLGIGGSPRPNGNSDIVLNQILKAAAKEDISTAKVHLRDIQFQGCIGCEKCRKAKICIGLKDGMCHLYPSILGAKGLVLVSPVHNYNVTAWMKAFIDRLYCFYIFDNNRPRGWASQLADQGRKALVAAVGEQIDAYDMGFTIEAMRRPIEALGYDVIGELPIHGIFDRGKVKENEGILDRARQLGTKLARALVG